MSQTPIDASVVKRVASLAKLALTADEELKLAGELRQIVSYVEQLGEVDVTRFEPLAHPTEVLDSLCADQQRPSLPVEDALRNSPQHDGTCFLVPPVLG